MNTRNNRATQSWRRAAALQDVYDQVASIHDGVYPLEQDMAETILVLHSELLEVRRQRDAANQRALRMEQARDKWRAKAQEKVA